jgi:hypothetical protein
VKRGIIRAVREYVDAYGINLEPGNVTACNQNLLPSIMSRCALNPGERPDLFIKRSHPVDGGFLYGAIRDEPRPTAVRGLRVFYSFPADASVMLLLQADVRFNDGLVAHGQSYWPFRNWTPTTSDRTVVRLMNGDVTLMNAVAAILLADCLQRLPIPAYKMGDRQPFKGVLDPVKPTSRSSKSPRR